MWCDPIGGGPSRLVGDVGSRLEEGRGGVRARMPSSISPVAAGCLLV